MSKAIVRRLAEGDHASRTNIFEFRGLPGGAYEVIGVLTGANGRRALTRQRIIVAASAAK